MISAVKRTVATEIAVELVRAWPDRCESMRLALPAGATIAQALAQAAQAGFADAQSIDAGMLAIFGRAATAATTLHDGDRIELLRPLLADPKQRRRERARKPG
jgi:putative ubiquitin-RnfH superfamily antitoxin RatB of RatAB toxin-antitoxin module